MHSKALSRRWLTALTAASALFIALHSVSAAAEDSGRTGFVYVMTNKNTGNSVIQYRRSGNGSLTWLNEVTTGGNGTGANGADPLGSQNSLVLGGEGKILLVDVGDDGVAGVPVAQPSAGASPFGIAFGHDGVAIVSEAAGSASSYRQSDDTLDVISGAVTDTQRASCWISVTKSARLAYVSNTGSGTISSFQISGKGELSLLNAVAANPGGAPIDSSLSRDSRFLYVVESAQGKTLIFRNNDSTLSPIGTVSVPVGSQGIAAQ